MYSVLGRSCNRSYTYLNGLVFTDGSVSIIYLTGPHLDDQGMDFILEGSESKPRFPVPILAKLILLWNLKQSEHIGLLLLLHAQLTSSPTHPKMDERKKIIIKNAIFLP
jgi:hypothetical protein